MPDKDILTEMGASSCEISSNGSRRSCVSRASKRVQLCYVYASHLSEQTKAEAKRLGIDLEFIPAGKTGKLQPLDCLIFGELKARVRAAVERDLAETGEIGANVFDALGHFLKAWKQITAENVVRSWSALLDA